MAPELEISRLAMIGCGSMGGGMALLFAEKGFHVSLSDPSEKQMDKIVKSAEDGGYGNRVQKTTEYKELCDSLGSPKLIVFSLPHGKIGDTVLEDLLPHLSNGDIVLDCGNENYENTQRRQGKSTTRGIRYIGCGVSGGYQAARRGPSMCPGGDEESLSMILPTLRKVAAKDSHGRPCVARCGLGGSGHYVKCIHNGIEHGMMSAIAEAWQIMSIGLGLDYEELAGIFETWNADGELRNTFLIKISADICRATFPDTDDEKGKVPSAEKRDITKHEHVLATVADKVVQDLTGEEGTGIWSNMEAVRLHVSAPTMTSAHFLRLASAYRGQREKVHELTQGGFPPLHLKLDGQDKTDFIEHLRKAVYASCLASYVQGLSIIEAAEQENKWDVDYQAVWQIWRAGCIIQADYISDEVLKPVFDRWAERKGKPLEAGEGESLNLLLEKRAAEELKKTYPSLKKVVAQGVDGDFIVPAMSATLEYCKYVSNVDLPTSFYEAQLDYFGSHMYDQKGERNPLPTTGKHHFEWRAA